MVREIICVQVGQCGNQVGNAFWDNVRQEHMLDVDGSFQGDPQNPADKAKLDKVNVYFKQSGKHRYVPRAGIVDLEPGTVDVLRASAIGGMFQTDNFVFGETGAGNNWAKGHYTEGAELIEEVQDIVRKEAEKSECPQGFQISHSLGGGTGSGLGTLILLKIRDAYPDRVSATFSVFPSAKVSDVVVEPYNAVLSIHQLLENSDETFVIDNEALFNISHNVLEQERPKFADLNYLICNVMAGITSSMRFSGKLNGDLRKLGVNLVAFPRLHFFLVAQAPLLSLTASSHVQVTIQELMDQCWSGRNYLSQVAREDGKYLATTCLFRGDIATQEVDENVAQTQSKMADDFVQWIPNNIKTTIVETAPINSDISATFVASTTTIKGVFQRISTNFRKLYKRRAFLHWYTSEGMDEMEFQEARTNCNDLVTEYQDKQDAVVDLDGDDDEPVENDDDEEF